MLHVQVALAQGDRGGDALRGIDLTLRAGEILAIAGVAGNGQRELAETITGMRTPRGARSCSGGRRLRGGDARRDPCRRRGRPRGQAAHGVAPSLSIASKSC